MHCTLANTLLSHRGLLGLHMPADCLKPQAAADHLEKQPAYRDKLGSCRASIRTQSYVTGAATRPWANVVPLWASAVAFTAQPALTTPFATLAAVEWVLFKVL